MKKAALAVLLLGAALCIPGCGFEEGAGASVTVIQATPTPIPTPTPEATPTPEVTPTPEPVVEQTASGVNVTKQDGTYVANADINLRADASADATWIAGVTSGTQLTSTGVCDNGWIEVSYEGQTAFSVIHFHTHIGITFDSSFDRCQGHKSVPDILVSL